MSDLLRDAPMGQIIRYVTRGKYMQYPEEKPGFELPEAYRHSEKLHEALESVPEDAPLPRHSSDATAVPAAEDLEKVETAADVDINDAPESSGVPSPAGVEPLENVGSRMALSKSKTREDLERAYTAAASFHPGPSRPIVPSRRDDGTILVDWYTTDDPSNPQNWSAGKKFGVAMQIYLYTLAVYMGSAIFAPSEPGVMEEFGVSIQVASLGLSMYVLAYGLGPMLWSPLSEIPAIGRNPPYLATFAIFVILIVPTALVENMPGLVVLRFLLGFFGSPCLATGGASLGDIYNIVKLPYVLSGWALAATCGPALGPIISGFSVEAENWRWSQWEMLWLAGPVWLVMFLCLPETSTPNLLLRRAQRIRKLTGNPAFRAQSEIDAGSQVPSLRDIAVESLWRPTQMNVLDPAVAFTSVYTALLYGIFYSFFESFELVFIGMYQMSPGVSTLTFLSITVGVMVSLVCYWSYLHWVVDPDMKVHGLGAPERRLIPALYASFLAPIGLFIFAWTSRPDIHWIAPVIGVATFTVSVFIILQCIFVYLPLTYPQYAASLFAGNDLTRSTLAAGAVHFSRPLFQNLGVDRGVSLLAGLCCGCVIGVFALWHWGESLRMRSKFTAK